MPSLEVPQMEEEIEKLLFCSNIRYEEWANQGIPVSICCDLIQFGFPDLTELHIQIQLLNLFGLQNQIENSFLSLLR